MGNEAPTAVMDRPPVPPAAATGTRRSRITPIRVLFAVSIALLLYFVAFPLAGMLAQSLRGEDGGLTLGGYAEFFTSERLLRATWNTLLVSTATGIGSVLIATPLAFGVARTNMWGKRLVRLAVIICFASPPFLMTLAYIFIAGPNAGYLNVFLRWLLSSTATEGPINIFSLGGFVLLALPNTIALVFIIMLPGFANMDSSQEEASRIAGAGPLETIWRVSLPSMYSGMMAGGLLSFSNALAMFATPQILGIDVLTVSMRRSILTDGDFRLAATIAAVSAVLSMSVLFLYRRSIRAGAKFQTITGKGMRVGLLDVGRGRHLFGAVGLLYVLLGALVPYTLMVGISFMRIPTDGFAPSNLTLDHYAFVLGDEVIQLALFNSLVLGLSAATVIAVLGFLLAFIITRTDIRGRAFLDYLTVIPVGIAGTAFAVGVIVSNLETPARALGLYATLSILLIAYIGRYIPFGVRTAQVALLQVSKDLSEASRVTGASQLRTLWHITLPLVRGGIIYAWILGFVQAFAEISASAILSGPTTQVAATALLGLWQGTDGLQRASALGVVMFLLTLALVAAAQRLGGQAVVPDSPSGRKDPA
ncbi:iron ABC transporter permease [Pseudonocardia nematodicida]|uniref:Iron ABC transporter permease n=1 Tax=Pseudonocardia nematodicida TaxID=1206997 RepID=A0ABV1KH33_9PSEU